jgi:hypothetical protein
MVIRPACHDQRCWQRVQAAACRLPAASDTRDRNRIPASLMPGEEGPHEHPVTVLVLPIRGPDA